ETASGPSTNRFKLLNLISLFGSNLGAWQSWTPSLTNITVGSGTVTGKYVQIGNLVIAKANFQTATNTTYSNATYKISLPVNFYTTPGAAQLIGTWTVYDSANNSFYGIGGLQIASASDAFLLFSTNVTGTY